jgi:hypothetical protein
MAKITFIHDDWSHSLSFESINPIIITSYDEKGNFVESHECVDGEQIALEKNDRIRVSKAGENGNVVNKYEIVNSDLISLEGSSVYSTEAALHINKAEGKSCINSLRACFTENSNSYITSFLIKIFVDSLGEGGSPKSGVFCYDYNNNLINISEFFVLLLEKLVLEIKNETKEAKANFIKRGSEIKNHFEHTKQLLIKAGWKEQTPFSKAEQNRFKEVITSR